MRTRETAACNRFSFLVNKLWRIIVSPLLPKEKKVDVLASTKYGKCERFAKLTSILIDVTLHDYYIVFAKQITMQNTNKKMRIWIPIYTIMG